MSWRYAYGLLATLILSTVLQATEVIVSGEIIHTLRYVTGPGPGFEVQDTLDNDSVWIIWGDESLSWNVGQVQLVLFHLPTPLAVCDCLYITVTATNLSFETFHGRTGIGMNIFPRDSTDTTAFQFTPWGSWGFYYTYDSLEYGQTYVHRTYEGLDTYFAYTLDHDYPACRDLIMAIGPAVVGDTHFVVTSTMHWFTQALSISEPCEHNPSARITIYPNPFADGFVYDGPRSRYRLYNILGQTIQVGNLEQKAHIQLSAIPAGTYFLHIDSQPLPQVITVRKLR